MTAHSGARENSVQQLERWFVHAPLRFLFAGLVLWICWALAAVTLSSLLAVERAVVPVLGRDPPAIEATHVLLVAPLAENAVLFAVFHAAWFCARQWWPGAAGERAATGLAIAAFSIAHWPFKVLYGIEMLAGAWLLTMCFLWGSRHGLSWRGWWLSVAAHVGVNAIALALFHA